MAAVTFPTAHGTTFTFGGATFAATNVKKKVTGNDPKDGRIDTTTLDMPEKSKRRYQDSPILSESAGETTITLTFFGATEPDIENVAAISFPSLGVTGQARCTEYELEGAVADVIKGTASFTIEPPEDTTP
jgi:hypothetical protein